MVTGGNEEKELAETYRDRARRLRFEFLFVATLVEDIAKSYEADAEFGDPCRNRSEVRHIITCRQNFTVAKPQVGCVC